MSEKTNTIFTFFKHSSCVLSVYVCARARARAHKHPEASVPFLSSSQWHGDAPSATLHDLAFVKPLQTLIWN